jgi:hypothetical protein
MLPEPVEAGIFVVRQNRHPGGGSALATLIPNRGTCSGRMTPGERRFSQRLEDKLDEDYLCWYDVVLHPNRGILILEVKDWKPETLADIDRDRVVLNTERGRVAESNPLRQARAYAMEILRLLQADPALLQPAGHRREGKLVMPWGFGVVLTNITRHQFEQMELDNFLTSGNVICRDEITEIIDEEEFQKRLWDMFMMPFPCQLTVPQIDHVRWHLFPQLRIQQQGELLPPLSSEPQSGPADIPDIIRIMDLQQELLARSLGDGHRVIHGVAGSGKTMILGYRSVELARKLDKPVLVLCFNKTLASRLEQIMVAHEVPRLVQGATPDLQLEAPALPKSAGQLCRRAGESCDRRGGGKSHPAGPVWRRADR